MEIPITISVSENTREFTENLFGMGEKVTDPEILKLFESSGKDTEDLRKVNSSVMINDNITLGQPSLQPMQKAMESYHPEQWFDWNLALFIADKTLNFGGNGFVIADWLWSHIKARKFKIKLNGKEITDKTTLQNTLDEYLKSTQDNQ
jgi:hypothetical protein